MSDYTGRIQRGPMAADVLQAHYTTVFNAAVRDKRLTRKARGLLVEILSHREGFGISMASLVAAGPEGKDAIRSALAELEKYGYLNRYRERNEQGQLGDPVYSVTDMPEGLQFTVEAPFVPSQEPAPQGNRRSEPKSENPPQGDEEGNRRSEPKSENPPQGDEEGNRRSEPKSGFPTLGFPTLDDPLHKKPIPSEAQSLSSVSDTSSAPERAEEQDGEREQASQNPGTDSPGGGDYESPGADASAAQGAELVVQAYVAAASAAGVIADRRDVTAIRRDAAGLLAEVADCTPEWLAQRAAEMPARGWSDLRRHVAKCKKPMRAPKKPERSGPCPRCMDSGWLEDENGFPAGKCDHRALVPA